MELDEIVKLTKKSKRQSDGSFLALCPAHKDEKTLSLHITQESGHILLKCFAGCQTDQICQALNIEISDLFVESEKVAQKKIVAEYTYHDENGNELYQVVRFEPKSFLQRHKNGGGEYVWKMDGVRRVLYHLPEVLTAKERVYVVEGEKDADNLRKYGLIATTSPGGANAWKPEYAEFLKDKEIIIIPDKDKAGYSFARDVRNSLLNKAKLKCVILPGDGKDVSDWLQSNKPDLLAQLEQDISVLDSIEEIKPSAIKTLNGFEFTWPDIPFLIYIDRLTSDAEAIISIKDRQGQLRHTSKINLLAPRSVTELSKKLTLIYKADWNPILDFVVNHCYSSLRDGGETVNVDIEPITMEIKYLLYPILPIGEPVTIFTAGGKGKSIMADYLAVLIQHGICAAGGLPFIPRGSANVLILDWESEEETHRRYINAIKNGLGITDYSFIAYRRLENPLAQIIDSIQTEIVERQIEFVILDSQMAATAGGSKFMSEAQQASEYYNLIRSFHCSTLTIDHITKASMTNTDGAEAPYGSIVKYNRSRSQFELRLPDDEEDSDHKEYALVHRKFNLGRKQKPIGIGCDFTNEGDKLIKIEYSSIELKDNPSLEKVLSLKERIYHLLLNGKLNLVTISEKLNAKEDSVKTILNRNKDMFLKIKDDWGVKSFP